MGGISIPEGTWKEILNQCDSDSDGQVFFKRNLAILFLINFIDFVFRIRKYINK